MRLVVAITSAILVLRQAEGGSVNKCCPQGSRLDEGLSCVKGGDPYPPPAPHTWAPASPPCPPPEADVTWGGDLLEEDGSVTVDGMSFPPGSFCLDQISDGNQTEDVAVLCPCRFATCVRKCCEDGTVLAFNKGHLGGSEISCIPPVNDTEIWAPKFKESGVEYYIFHRHFPTCENGVYLLNVKPPFIDYTLHKDGSVEVGGTRISSSAFCLDNSIIEGLSSPNLVACRLQVSPPYMKAYLYAVLYLVGAFFLTLTLLVHFSLPELRKTVHTKNLTSHVASLLVGYLILSATSLGFSPLNKTLCILFAFALQFTFLSAFFWLNVMCIDIAWTFSHYKPPHASSISESDGKKYIYYSIYVWFFTILITLLTFGAELAPKEIIGSLDPSFGTTKCWFGSKLPAFVFFYFPSSILFVLNIILFIFTSIKIIQARRNSAILQRTDSYKHQGSRFSRCNERRVILYFKLFLLMGITWIFDFISWAVDNNDKYIIFYFTDGINALRGVFIFFLFCCKPKTLELLKTKISIIGKLQHHFKKYKPNLIRQSTETSTFQYPTSTQFTQLTE